MDRRLAILEHISRSGLGLEIGPSFRPIAPKSEGYNVRVLDHLPTDELRAKYATEGVDVGRIEEVDHVWSGQPYRDLVGSRRFDWIIASHVIEHSTCLVTFLNDCASILKPSGVLSLAVPDKRYCFDIFREKTGLARVIDVAAQHPKIHSAGTAAEHYLNIALMNGAHGWNAFAKGALSLPHDLAGAKQAIQRIEADGAFVDLHNWVFTPTSFRLIIEDLFQLGYISLREFAFRATQEHEFFVTLSQRGNGPGIGRLVMLSMNRNET